MAFRNINVIIGANTVGLQTGLRQASAQLQAFVRQLNTASNAGAGIGAGANAGAAGLNNLNRGLGAGLNSMGRFNAAGSVGARMLAAWNSQVGMLSRSMAGLGVFVRETAAIFTGFLAVNATIRAVTSAVRFLTDAFMEFDKQLTNSMAIMGQMTDKMEEGLVRGVKEIAATTTFTAAEASEGLYFIASAGFDAQSSLAALPVAAKFAQAGLLDMATSTEYLLDVTRAYNKVVENEWGEIDPEPTIANMTRISDVITKAAIDSNATIDQLAAALTNKAAGASRLLGMEIEETTAALETFASVGIKGQVAGTQFNMVVRDLQKVAVNSGAELHALGIEVFDVNGNFNNLSQILMQFQKAMGSMSDEQKRATLSMLGFQDRSLGAILAISDMGAEMATFENRLKTAGGTTQDVAERQLQSLSAQLQLLKNRIGNFAIDAGRSFMEWFAATSEATEGTREAVVGFFSELIDVAKPVVSSLMNVGKAVAGIGAAVANSAIGFAFSWMTNLPVLAVAASIAIQRLSVVLGSHLPGAAVSAAGASAAVGSAVTSAGFSMMRFANTLVIVGNHTTMAGRTLTRLAIPINVLSGAISGAGLRVSMFSNTIQYASARLLSLNATTAAVGAGFARFGAFVSRNLSMINTGILLFVTFWQQSLSEAKTEADQFVASLTQGIDTSNWEGLVEAYERVRRAQNEAVEDFDEHFGKGGFFENRFTRLGNMWESMWDAFGGENNVDEIIERENKLSEAAAKLHNSIENVMAVGQIIRSQNPSDEILEMKDALGLTADASFAMKASWDTAFEGLVQNTEASNAIVFKSMQQLGYDMEKPMSELMAAMKPEDFAAITAQIDSVKHAARFAGNEFVDWANVGGEELEGLLSRSAAVEEGMVDMFAAMVSAADAYKASLLEVADAQDIWSDLVSETTDSYNEAMQEAQEAAEDAASARADALSASADDTIDALEDQKQAELDALSISSRESKEVAREAAEGTDVSDAIESASDANVDAITDSSTAEKRAIEKKYDDQIEAVREGSRAAADAAGEVGDFESVDKVIPAAQAFLDTLNTQITGYKDYQDSLSELVRAGASVELVDMFRNMDPEEGKALMAQILDPTKNFVAEFNTALSDLGKVETSPNWDILKQQMDAKVDNMKDFSYNAQEIAYQTGVSVQDVLAVATDMEKAGIPVSEAFAGFLDQISMGNTDDVREMFEQWKVMGNKTIPEAVKGMDGTLDVMSAIIHGDVEKMEAMMGSVSPEQFYEQLYNMGFDETFVRMISVRFDALLEDMDSSMRVQAQRMIDYLNGQVGQVAWNTATGRFDRVDADFGLPAGGGYERFAEGGFMPQINAFASGSERHMAEIARGGPIRVWNEPETGGEAYIPLAEQKRARSTAILAEVARQFGYGLYKQYNNGGYWNATAMQNTSNSTMAPQVVVVPVQSHNTYQFGDIQGVRMEDAEAYAQRKKRQRNLTT